MAKPEPANGDRPPRPLDVVSPDALEHRRLDCGEVHLDCRLAGPEDAPLVVLLHGFPESWYSWRHQIAALAPAFRVAAPSLRGYGESDRPQEIDAYRIERLVGDVVGLIRRLGRERAHVVAHDWGGGIAWALAASHPEVCDKLVVCNCPHPVVFQRVVRSNPRQLLKSWYMFFFQLPWLPEWLLSLGDFRAIERAFRGMVRRRDREVFTDADLAEIKAALRPPGALRAAINYYRAAFGSIPSLPAFAEERPIPSPTLLVWAEEDDSLLIELTHGMEPLFSGPFSIRYVPNCSHWVQQERPEEVNAALLEFLGRV